MSKLNSRSHLLSGLSIVALTGAVLLITTSVTAHDTGSPWTFIKGETDQLDSGERGLLGTPDINSLPAARQDSVSWVDNSGTLWMFGGEGVSELASGMGYLDDLWKFDIPQQTWTWVKGDANFRHPAVYGEKGQGEPENTPGARSNCCTWTDAAGDLWMFGGYGDTKTTPYNSEVGMLCDLWKFDVSENNWIWVSGKAGYEQNPVYGTKGTPGTGNVPVPRYSAASWTDQAGHLWLYGGMGETDTLSSTTRIGLLNDLWMYDIPDKTWTWVDGSAKFYVKPDNGSLGIAADTNTPGGRMYSTSWIGNDGNLWLFGGTTFPSYYEDSQYLNDLWKYNINSKKWTWIKGSNQKNPRNQYGTKGVSADANTPGGRCSSVGWKDKTGNFWLFGGYERFSSDDQGRKSDLWKYDITSGNWSWINGSTNPGQYGVYGSPGIQADSNIPGSRRDPSSWTDADGNFWLFGGDGFDDGVNSSEDSVMNDLWKFGNEAATTSANKGWEIYP